MIEGPSTSSGKRFTQTENKVDEDGRFEMYTAQIHVFKAF